MTNPEAAAFAVTNNDGGIFQEGLSKREFMATMILQGIVSASEIAGIAQGSRKIIVDRAVLITDELIERLNKK